MFTKKSIINGCVSVALMVSSSVFAHDLNVNHTHDKLMDFNLHEFEKVTSKMDIIPGIWRPMFGSEQVAWISPPWESEEYIWVDFPEAIFVDGKMIYLGHIDQRFPTPYPTLKSVSWKKTAKGISYEQTLPNGVSFGGEISKASDNIVEMTMWIKNGSGETLKNVKVLSCVFLNAIKEFSENSDSNKLIHVKNKGWVSFPEVEKMASQDEGYGYGWLYGTKKMSDLPVVVTQSKIKNHLLGVTWFDHTDSFIGNPNHPCVHANPFFDDIKPGDRQELKGEMIFFEGSMDEFETMFRKRLK